MGVSDEHGPVTAVVVGAGVRGRIYADVALEQPDRFRVVAVAEPVDGLRNALADQHGIDPELRFTDWRDLATRAPVADVAIIATQDADHVEPAAALASLGYHLLLEKPIAPTWEECERLLTVVERAGVLCAVCHVLRYTPYTQALLDVVSRGTLGDIVSLEHTEPVGYWHMAHSYVRGNWRRADQSSSMLLAKSCHDLDWISYVMGSPCTSVASFGGHYQFRRDRKPAAAGDATRCLDCATSDSCPFDAARFYLGLVRSGDGGWPVDVVASPATEESVLAALRDGPYGRCVYECDNDVVDHQVVAMEFETGATAVFTMTGLSEAGHRRTTIFGTAGELRGDGENIETYDYLTQRTGRIDLGSSDATLAGGHGGGDDGLVSAFISAVATGDRSLVVSDLATSVASHRLVFAAEEARTSRTTVRL
jgi:predicted dehydrogenase